MNPPRVRFVCKRPSVRAEVGLRLQQVGDSAPSVSSQKSEDGDGIGREMADAPNEESIQELSYSIINDVADQPPPLISVPVSIEEPPASSPVELSKSGKEEPKEEEEEEEEEEEVSAAGSPVEIESTEAPTEEVMEASRAEVDPAQSKKEEEKAEEDLLPAIRSKSQSTVSETAVAFEEVFAEDIPVESTKKEEDEVQKNLGKVVVVEKEKEKEKEQEIQVQEKSQSEETKEKENEEPKKECRPPSKCVFASLCSLQSSTHLMAVAGAFALIAFFAYRRL